MHLGAGHYGMLELREQFAGDMMQSCLPPAGRASMRRRLAACCLACIGTALLTVSGCDRQAERLRRTQEAIIAIDSHVDIPFDFATKTVDPGMNGPDQVDLLKMKEGGLDAAFFIVFVEQGARTPEGFTQARIDATKKFEAIHRMAEAMYPDRIEIAYSTDDVQRIHAQGKLVALIGIENGYVLGLDTALIETYYKLGGRYLTLAHNGHNDLADSAQPRREPAEPDSEHGGLSELGRAAVEVMNRTGMLVDVSHISKAAALQAIAHSAAPVIASHSGVKAIHDHARNLDDQTMQVLAAKDGVLQVVAYDGFLKPVPAEKAAAVKELEAAFGLSQPDALRGLPPERRAEFERQLSRLHETWPRASVQDLVDHIDYAVKLMGIDHVGIASDFGGGGGIEGWDNAAQTANVTAELMKRGYQTEEIAKLWGGNLLRVMREAEAVARREY
jgi:membrane dipeptidase